MDQGVCNIDMGTSINIKRTDGESNPAKHFFFAKKRKEKIKT